MCSVESSEFFKVDLKFMEEFLKRTIWTTGRLDEASRRNSPCQKGMSPQTNVAH